MTEKEIILKKVIEKARKNGYLYGGYAFDADHKFNGLNFSNQVLYKDTNGVENVDEESINDIIFDHSFCKAFFGTEILWRLSDDKKTWTQAWQYHIAQLALAEDRLKYLGNYI